EVVAVLQSIHHILMVPALTTIARPFRGLELNEDPVPLPDPKTLKQLLRKIVSACDRAAKEAQILTRLSNEVYVLADHVREQERDFATLKRLENRQGTPRLDTLPTTTLDSKTLTPLTDQTATPDYTAFRPASEFLNQAGFPKSFGELRRTLEDNAWIRRDR